MRPSRTRPAARLGLLVGGIALALLTACSNAGSPPPNIVLITVDTLRADRLAPYGYDQIETPGAARLAREGILFERAYADTPWTLSSLSSVMTGTYPTEHRVRSWSDRLDLSRETLAEILAANGYTTAAIVGSYPLDRYFGLAQGFDHYDDEMTEPMFLEDGPAAEPAGEVPSDDSRSARALWQVRREATTAFRSDARVADAAIAWIEGAPASPFFLWVHFFGPHEKGKRRNLTGAAQLDYVVQQAMAYAPAVAAADREVARLLDALDAVAAHRPTAVIFHSDHGQSLREPNRLFGHGRDLFDSTVHVPLIIRLPDGARAGERIPRLVRNLDIFATVLRLARLPVPNEESRDLLGPPSIEDPHIYLETFLPLGFTTRTVQVGDRKRQVGETLRGIRQGDSKLITRRPTLAYAENHADPLPDEYVRRNAEVELYDAGDDPREVKNVVERKKSRAAALLATLDGHLRDSLSPMRPPSSLDPATVERLRSLGYDPEPAQ